MPFYTAGTSGLYSHSAIPPGVPLGGFCKRRSDYQDMELAESDLHQRLDRSVPLYRSKKRNSVPYYEICVGACLMLCVKCLKMFGVCRAQSLCDVCLLPPEG